MVMHTIATITIRFAYLRTTPNRVCLYSINTKNENKMNNNFKFDFESINLNWFFGSEGIVTDDLLLLSLCVFQIGAQLSFDLYLLEKIFLSRYHL